MLYAKDMLLTLIIGFVLGVAALLFITENTAVVALTFLHWQFQSSIAMLVLLAILVGVALTLLMFLPSVVSDAFHMRKLRKNNEALAREADAQRQSAHDAHARLAAVDGSRPDVVDLSQR